MRAMSRFVVPSVVLAAVLAPVPDASARAYYAPLGEVEDSVGVAVIVETEAIADVEIDGEYWHYQQLVDARVIEAIAGEATPRVEVLGGRDFACAPVHWAPNTRYLALLHREGGRWTATNNEWGRLEIVGGAVDWPYDDTEALVPVEQLTAMLASRLEGRLGPGRIVDAAREAELPTPPPLEPDATDGFAAEATDTKVDARVAAASPVPWIALGAGAVALGFLVGARRRR
jgi:hypothetical protein